jgi:hypothetical protein
LNVGKNIMKIMYMKRKKKYIVNVIFFNILFYKILKK